MKINCSPKPGIIQAALQNLNTKNKRKLGATICGKTKALCFSKYVYNLISGGAQTQE